MKKITINYLNYLVPTSLVSDLVAILCESSILDSEGTLKGITFEVTDSPDAQREKDKATIKEGFATELAKYERWWLEERATSAKLTEKLQAYERENT